MEGMGARWDDAAGEWVVPSGRESDLDALISDLGADAPTDTFAPAEAAPLQAEEVLAHVRQHVVPPDPEADRGLRTYGRMAFQPLNEYLRGESTPDPVRRERLDALTDQVDRAIAQQAPIGESVILHRYSFTNLNLEVGRDFVDPAFVSTSMMAGVFGGNAPLRQGDLIRIVAPPGTRGADMVGLGAANSAQEMEYLLPRNSRFVVEAIDDSGTGARVVDMRLVP